MISVIDKEYHQLLRKNVEAFLGYCAQQFDREGLLLDVAPEAYAGAKAHFHQATVRTLDLNPQSNADYILDICVCNGAVLAAGTFDMIVCTEVLEHTLDPFAAVREIRRLLCPCGLLFLSTPFNFRVHGPAPDCWRFTEFGLRHLLRGMEIIELKTLPTPERDLMPIQYTVIARA